MSNRSAMRLIVPATVLALLATACSSSDTHRVDESTSPSASTPAGATSAQHRLRRRSAAEPSAAVSSSATADTEKATINYFTLSAAPDHLADLNKIVQAFEVANPNITVKVQTACTILFRSARWSGAAEKVK